MRNFVKILLLLGLLSVPLLASAQTFDNNLYFGITNNSDVTMLQEFLTDQGVYSGPITGNFFSLTLAGVKAFQSANNIEPVAGFFGPLTRAKANEILSVQLNASNQQAITETGTTAPAITQSPATNNVQQLIQNLQTQILALQQQLIQMQQQNQTVQNQQTQTQTQQTQIQQNQQSQTSSTQQQTTSPSPTTIISQPESLKPAYTINLSVGSFFPTNNSSTQSVITGTIQDEGKEPNYRYKVPASGNPRLELYLDDKLVASKTCTLANNNMNNGYGSCDVRYEASNLSPETTYSYKVIYKEDGREDSIKTGTFKTSAIDPTTQISFDQNKLSVVVNGAESNNVGFSIKYDRQSPINNTSYKTVASISGGPADIRISESNNVENIFIILQPLTANTNYEYKLNLAITNIDGSIINIEKPITFRTPSGNLGDYTWYPYNGSNLSYANIAAGTIICVSRIGKNFISTDWPWPDFKVMSSMIDFCP